MNIKNNIGLFLLLVTLLYAEPGFFSDTYEARIFVTPTDVVEKEAVTGEPTMTITVNADDTVAAVLPTLFGNNENSVMGDALLTDDEYGLAHMRRAAMHTLRLPGGTWTNQWLWDGINHWGDKLKENYLEDGVMSLPTHSWNYTTDEMLDLCSLSGAKPQICVNFALARYIDAPDAVEQAASYAAQWVREVNMNRKLGVQYWEVGNENYGEWEKGFVVGGDTITAEFYAKGFRVFVDSMKAVDPSIKIGAVVLGANEWAVLSDWTETVIARVADKADFLAVHDYFNWKPDANDITETEVLNGLQQIAQNRIYLDQLVQKHHPQGETLPIGLTEFNIFAGRKNSSFLGALFLSRTLGELIKEGYGLANLWGTVGGWDESGQDMGMLSRGEPGVKEYTPRASFFPYYYYDRCFGDQLLSSSSSKSAVTVYASRFSSGQIGLVVSNSSDRSERAEITLTGCTPGKARYSYCLDADSLSARSFRINGIGSESGLHGPENYAEIKALKHPVDGSVLVDVPANSITFTVIESKDDAPVQGEIQRGETFFCRVVGRRLLLHGTPVAKSLSLYSITGEELYVSSLNTGQESVALPTALSPGLYLLQIDTDRGQLSTRIVL